MSIGPNGTVTGGPPVRPVKVRNPLTTKVGGPKLAEATLQLVMLAEK